MRDIKSYWKVIRKPVSVKSAAPFMGMSKYFRWYVGECRRREWSADLPGGSLNLHGLLLQLVRACMCRDSHEQSNVIGCVLIPT